MAEKCNNVNSNSDAQCDIQEYKTSTVSSTERKISNGQDGKKGGCCKRYTYRQWTIFLLFCAIFICGGMTYSLQAPFYPKLATDKGASPTVYGLVFGVFELVNFIMCPIYGKNIKRVGAKLMLNTGNYTMAICCILFGFLDRIPSGTPFIAFSFIIRIIEALGQAAYLTSAYAVVVHEFPDNVATTLSILETTYGVGMMLGPATGGFMYELGGYVTPFAVIGGLLLLASFVTTFLLPKIERTPGRPTSIFQLIQIPAIAISYYVEISVAFSLGFTFSLLEPHLRQFGLPMSLNGLIFIVNGGTYALTAIFWGYIADKGVSPKLLCGTGGVFVALSFTLMGPAPFLPIKQELWLLILALVLHGIGGGGEYLASFLDSTQEAISRGYPDNIETYGLISGMWLSGISLGSFLGPSICGVLYDQIGFSYSTLVVTVMHILVAILNFGYYFHKKNGSKRQKIEDKENSKANELLLSVMDHKQTTSVSLTQ